VRSFAKLCVQFLSGLDALLLAYVLTIAWPLEFERPFPNFLFVLLIVPFWSTLYSYFGLYESHRLEGLLGLTRKVASAQLTGLFVLSLSKWLLRLPVSNESLVRFSGLTAIAVIVPRYLLYVLLQSLRRRGYDQRNVCVIGSWETAGKLAESFAQTPAWGLRVALVGVGPVSSREFFAYTSRERRPGKLEEVLRNEVIDEVFASVDAEELPKEEPTFELCRRYGLERRILLQLPSDKGHGARLEYLPGGVTLAVTGIGRPEGAIVFKRALDLVGAVFLLLLLSPVLLVLAALVKLSSPGPVFFRQERVGLHGRRFTMYKFRTMIDGAESLVHTISHRSITKGPVFKASDDWRMTDIGRVLRRFSLDELPQLFNVVKADMSLVGPRPLPVSESRAIEGEHRRRFSMRPGLTCLWQVNGRSNVEYHRWMKYDLEYIDNWSLWLDTKLLLRTIPAVMSGKGAY
jgi:exopolysaccharide biosynthesis polyprenyl glycosylphosphotransferase